VVCTQCADGKGAFNNPPPIRLNDFTGNYYGELVPHMGGSRQSCFNPYFWPEPDNKKGKLWMSAECISPVHNTKLLKSGTPGMPWSKIAVGECSALTSILLGS